MRKRSKFTLITDNCRRCGKQITTGSRSLHGLEALKAKYGSICSACLTEDERSEMLQAMGAGIARKLS